MEHPRTASVEPLRMTLARPQGGPFSSASLNSGFDMPLDRGEVPFEGSPGFALGVRLHDLAALHSASETILHRKCSLLSEILFGDPDRVFDFIRSPACGTNGLRFSVGIRDDIRLALAGPTDDFDPVHEHDPKPLWDWNAQI